MRADPFREGWPIGLPGSDRQNYPLLLIDTGNELVPVDHEECLHEGVAGPLVPVRKG